MAAVTYTIKALDESSWDAFAGLVEREQRRLRRVAGASAFIPRSRQPRAGAEPGTQARTRAGGKGARGPRVRRRRLRGLVPVRSAGRGAEDQEPRRLREGLSRSAGLADRLQLRRQGTQTPRRGNGGARRARSTSSQGLGGGKVEGYPEDAGSVPAGFLFNGALSTYERLGFIRDRKIGKHRWVVTEGRRGQIVGPEGPPVRHRDLCRAVAALAGAVAIELAAAPFAALDLDPARTRDDRGKRDQRQRHLHVRNVTRCPGP